ncbi:MAG: hypothetical protein V7677_17535 [Motiliproteus sp.]
MLRLGQFQQADGVTAIDEAFSGKESDLIKIPASMGLLYDAS